VDLIVDQVEGAVDRLTETAETVREVVDAPIHLVNEVADRVRRGFRRRGHGRDHGARHHHAEEASGAAIVLAEIEELRGTGFESRDVFLSKMRRALAVSKKG